MEDMNKGPDQVLQKLYVGSESVTDDSKALFLKACARLIGKESLLHVGYRALTDKFGKNKEFLTNHIAKVEKDRKSYFNNNFSGEKNMIMLSPTQLQALRTIQTNKTLKYYCFVGGSGTGKTHMSLLTVDHLITRYRERDPSQNIQVYLTYRGQGEEENSALQNFFQSFSDAIKGNVTFHISTFESLGKSKIIIRFRL